MNKPMRTTKEIKTVYAKVKGLELPPRVKKLLIGSEVIWVDNDPLSMDNEVMLHYFFNEKVNAAGGLLLKKYGFNDVSQFVNVRLKWGVQMEMYYTMPNRQDAVKQHMAPHYFEFHGLIYPMNATFKQERDKFYMLKNMEMSGIPDDHKNKKVYATTKFVATVLNI